ncbi:MAG TPA: transglycosylase family protein [Solirubrobacterales bacterium]|nr:transglycosylase family protein [Solirubrobacterales bacterium]
MLTKRSHIVPVLAISLALPATALASTGGADGSAEVGVGDARALTVAPLQRPIDRFQRLVQRVAHRIRVEERVAAQRQRREAFATLPGGVSQATLESIAACESGGDPTAVSADGTYRGLYQFDFGTWESVGGHGDPAAASAAEQSYRAALLYSRSGSSPWPVCG